MFPEYTIGFSIIAAIFYLIWTILYPSILWESMTFRNHEGFKGHLASVACIVFFLGFVNLVIIIANKVNG